MAYQSRVILVVQVLAVVSIAGAAMYCSPRRNVCVPIRYCPHVYDAIVADVERTIRNATLRSYVASISCHGSSQEHSVCCKRTETTVDKRCINSVDQVGRCVTAEKCESFPAGHPNAITRRKGQQSDICYQEGAKKYYCCTETTGPSKKAHTPSGERENLKIDNVFPPCTDPAGKAGRCVPVRHCDYIHSAFRDLSINHNQGLANFVRKSRCESDAKDGQSVCCANQRRSTVLIRHTKAAKLGMGMCGSLRFGDKILNGHDAGLGQYPWMASLMYKSRGKLVNKCSGTLIHARYVLTAAHCIKSHEPVLVRLGEYDFGSNPDCSPDGLCASEFKEYGIERLIPNENFWHQAADYDIGLVRLAEDAQLSEKEIYPICLPITEHLLMLKPKQQIVTGWGATGKSKPAAVLQEAKLDLVGRTLLCEGESTMCARGRQLEAHCRGDSGGPYQAVIFVGREYKYVQFGVVSGGPKYCTEQDKQPGVGVMVGYFINWILDNMDI